jgi:hypothetical protein
MTDNSVMQAVNAATKAIISMCETSHTWDRKIEYVSARIMRCIALAQPESLTGCLRPGNEPKSCQYEGGCQSEACDHWNKTEYRARMTVLAQVDGILYPKETT